MNLLSPFNSNDRSTVRKMNEYWLLFLSAILGAKYVLIAINYDN